MKLAVNPQEVRSNPEAAMDKIGRYLIEKRLGQGGMGVVYKCRDPQTDQTAAVKVLPQQLAVDPMFLQRFKREIMALQRLDHPNIVRIYEYGEADGAYYYAMEYADGEGLDSILEKKEKMGPLEAIRIVTGCAEALEHSHSRGIVHRDIKPANIILTKKRGIKVTDFGIAKVLDATRMTATQGVLGTVEYMSPEQSQGRRVDARSDLYSLGVMLYQCLTTHLPISGTNPTEVIVKLRTHQIESPAAWVPELPTNLVDLVMRLLEKDPAKRVESARELLRELDRVRHQIEAGIAGHHPVAAERMLTTGARSSASLWKNPWLLALAVLTIAAGFWIARPKTAQPPPLEAETTSTSMQAKLLLQWARGARKQNKYEIATRYYTFIITHFPATPQAKMAREELDDVADPVKADSSRHNENEELPPDIGSNEP